MAGGAGDDECGWIDNVSRRRPYGKAVYPGDVRSALPYVSGVVG